MTRLEKVMKGTEVCLSGGLPERCKKCPYHPEGCDRQRMKDTLEVLKAQGEVMDALLKVGYPHNFQREEPWIRNYMYAITDVVKKAIHLNKEDGQGENDASEKERCLELASHAIGMDSRKAFTTHGEKVYIPYRNYFTCPQPEAPWESMVEKGYARRIDHELSVEYRMTPDGIQWMARELKINIALKY